MKTKTKLFSIFIVLFASFAGSLLVPSHVEAQPACTLETGQFRTYDYGLGSNADWFLDSIEETGQQPYIYLDLKFVPACVGTDFIVVTIKEYDSIGSDTTALSLPHFSINNNNELQKTIVLKAGDMWCDPIDSPDCNYFLFLSIYGVQYSFDAENNNPLYREYHCYGDCNDQTWQHISTENGTYNQYLHPEDPDLLALQNNGGGIEAENDGGIEGENDGGIEAENEEPLLSVGELETISNPLGDGSTLPAFVNSLIGIFVRFMIPIIVLAYIYTGFRYVLARGNPTKLGEVHKLFLTVVIGSAIVLGAWTIATIITTTVNAIL